GAPAAGHEPGRAGGGRPVGDRAVGRQPPGAVRPRAPGRPRRRRRRGAGPGPRRGPGGGGGGGGPPGRPPAPAGGTPFLNLEDETGLVNVICSRGVWARYRRVGRTAAALLVR